jgi:hypothetical protein
MRVVEAGPGLAPAGEATSGARRGLSGGILLGLFGLSGLISTACTEDPLGSAPDQAPGASAPTVEVFVPVDELIGWRDTSLTGFALATEASFALLSDDDQLQARFLGRFPLADTLISGGDTLPADSFPSATVRIVVDTANSTLDRAGTIRVHALERSFDEFSVSWLEAREGEPWSEPGGDLGPLLGSLELTGMPDTLAPDSLVVELESPVDSLLRSWTGTEGEPGIAIVLEGPDVSLRVLRVFLRYEAILEGEEEPELFQRVASPSTFITDVEQPPTGSGLRVGGIPASRAYISFVVPESIAGFPVRGSKIGAAQLVFRSLDPLEGPFRLNQAMIGGRVDLLLDPFEFGVKTPIGGTTSLFVLNPDSLAVDIPVRVDVTSILAEQADLPSDSVKEVWLGLRAVPDGQSFGFWELGSVEAPHELRPQLVVILTPPPEFRLPR